MDVAFSQTYELPDFPIKGTSFSNFSWTLAFTARQMASFLPLEALAEALTDDNPLSFEVYLITPYLHSVHSILRIQYQHILSINAVAY